jgi:mono/diheme cytochrome c family protein
VLKLLTSVRRERMGPAAAAVALAGMLALAGCDLNENADVERGRQLFSTQCGTCHTLAGAPTKGTLGPDLDAAFAQARADGMDNDTIEGVVQAQISNPRPANPNDQNLYMPPDLVEGQDAEDVAAFVASVAGVPGIKPPQAPGGPGGQVFAQNGCGGCHTFAAAKSTGTTGPNLDDVLPGKSAKQINEDIVDPNAQITPGYPANTMPANFESTIDPQDLKLLIKFLMENAGKGGGG